MSLGLWLAYVATVTALVLFPGPSVLLATARALDHGLPKSLATVGGDLSANVVQMLVAGSGLVALGRSAPDLLELGRWIGVAYLALLGLRMTRHAARVATAPAAPECAQGPLALYLEGFGVSIANPKALLFFGGLFPGFLSRNGSIAHQMMILGLTFVVLDGSALSLWAGTAQWLRRKPRRIVRLKRTSGLLLMAAAAGLAIK